MGISTGARRWSGRDFGLLKKVGLPTLYWNFMLRGLA